MNQNYEFRKDQIASHLEYLGYDVENKEDHIFAKHAKYLNILVKFLDDGTSIYGLYSMSESAKNDRAGVLEAINKFNLESYCTKFFMFEDASTLCISAWIPGEYEKLSFGKIMSRFNDDLIKVRINSGLEQYIR